MRIQLNLASRPFVELGPLYTRLRILMVVLALIAAPLWLLLVSERHKADEASARLSAVEQNTRALELQRESFQAEMRQPANAVVLSQSQFLNTLFASKAFSWTAVMMDLENVLPNGVQVLSIDPVIDTKTGKVSIRLRVNGPHDRGVDLVRNLERSRRFLFPRVVRETAESNQNQRLEPVSTAASNVNFDLLADYNPLPETASKKTAPAPAAAQHQKAPGALTRHKAKPGAPVASPRPNASAKKVAP